MEYFGSGGGTLLVPILNNIIKIDEHKSHATALAINSIFNQC